MEILALVASLITAAGLGGVIGAFFQNKFAQQSKLEQHQFELKQKRYLCILILMLAKIEPDKSKAKLKQFRPDLQSPEDLDEELKTELLNAVVYSDNDVLRNFSAFIQAPSKEGFVYVASSIRKDLWGKRSQLSEEVKKILKTV